MPSKKKNETPAPADEALAAEAFSYTEGLTQLAAILNKLQDESTPLEESFTLFRQGSELLKQCRAYLDTTEMQVRQVIADAEGNLHDNDFA